jgi:hypothetical protein
MNKGTFVFVMQQKAESGAHWIFVYLKACPRWIGLR